MYCSNKCHFTLKFKVWYYNQPHMEPDCPLPVAITSRMTFLLPPGSPAVIFLPRLQSVMKHVTVKIMPNIYCYKNILHTQCLYLNYNLVPHFYLTLPLHLRSLAKKSSCFLFSFHELQINKGNPLTKQIYSA